MINKNQLLEIYLDGFNDSRSFAEWFIGGMRQENTFVHIENDMLISAGYIVDKPARIFGTNTVLPYLSALSTKKEFRGKGKIALVIKQAFEALYLRECAYAVLNPFHNDYYKRFGFANISFCKSAVIAGGKDYYVRQANKNDIGILCDIEKVNADFFDNYLIKGEEEILRLIENFCADGISCNLIYESDKPVAFYFRSSSRIEYYASVSPNILGQAESLKGIEYDDYFMVSDTYIQGRIVNVEKALLDYPYDANIRGVYKFVIRDNFLKNNNKEIIVEILNGSAKLSSKMPDKQYYLDISELCGLMFLGGEVFGNRKNLFKDKY